MQSESISSMLLLVNFNIFFYSIVIMLIDLFCHFRIALGSGYLIKYSSCFFIKSFLVFFRNLFRLLFNRTLMALLMTSKMNTIAVTPNKQDITMKIKTTCPTDKIIKSDPDPPVPGIPLPCHFKAK